MARTRLGLANPRAARRVLRTDVIEREQAKVRIAARAQAERVKRAEQKKRRELKEAAEANYQRRFQHAIEDLKVARGKRGLVEVGTGVIPPLNDVVIQQYLNSLFTSTLPYFKNFEYSQRFKADLDAIQHPGESRCGGHRSLLLHQAVARTLTTMLAEGKDADQRGFLFFASTGSGKTVTALAMMLAFWNTDKRIVFCTTPDNMKDNSLDTYADNLAEYFPKVIPRHGSESKEAWHDRLVAQLRHRLHNTWSFTRLASKLGLGGRIGASNPHFLTEGAGSVVIMDEAHSIAAPKQPQYVEKYRALRNYLTRADVQRQVDVIALTATPGDAPQEVLDLMSLVRRKSQSPFKLADYTNAAGRLNKQKLLHAMLGLVSHVNLNGDTGRVARTKVHEHNIPMRPEHYEIYRSRVLGMPATKLHFHADKKRLFYETARKATGEALLES